jgi:hypothetical protein
VVTVVTVVLWNHEPVYESPARREFFINWEGELLRADVTLDFDPNFWFLPVGTPYLDKIIMNGTQVNWVGDPNHVVIFDAKPYLRKGANYIEVYHNARGVPGFQTAGLYAYVVVEATGPVGGEIRPPTAFEIPGSVVLLGLGGLAVLGLYFYSQSRRR